MDKSLTTITGLIGSPRTPHIDSFETTEGNGKGLPLAFLSLGTRRIIEDLEAGRVILPSPDEPQRAPRTTPQFDS